MQADDLNSIDAEALRVLRHDIKNHLSNIIMAVEQLRYEVSDPSPDCSFYMDTISDSCTKINQLLNNAGPAT